MRGWWGQMVCGVGPGGGKARLPPGGDKGSEEEGPGAGEASGHWSTSRVGLACPAQPRAWAPPKGGCLGALALRL